MGTLEKNSEYANAEGRATFDSPISIRDENGDIYTFAPCQNENGDYVLIGKKDS